MGIAIKSGDSILFGAAGNAAGFTVRLDINFTRKNGVVDSLFIDVGASSDRTLSTTRLSNLPDGELTSAAATVTAGGNPTEPGVLYVNAILERLIPSTANIAIILGGYIYSGGPSISYPGSIVGMLDGPGQIINRRVAATALIAAGVSIVSVPANTRWKLKQVRLVLVTSPTVGNRLIVVHIRDPNSNIVSQPISSAAGATTGRTVAASTTERYAIGPLADAAATVSSLWQTNQELAANWNIFVDDTANIDATNDTIGAEILVEEWISG